MWWKRQLESPQHGRGKFFSVELLIPVAWQRLINAKSICILWLFKSVGFLPKWRWKASRSFIWSCGDIIACLTEVRLLLCLMGNHPTFLLFPLPSGSITWAWPASFCHSYFPRDPWIKFPMTLTGEMWSNVPSQGANSHQHNIKRIKKKREKWVQSKTVCDLFKECEPLCPHFSRQLKIKDNLMNRMATVSVWVVLQL